MGRLLRILGKMIAAVLLLLCLALLGLWVRSYWRGDEIEHLGTVEARGEFAMRHRGLWSERGWVWANVQTHWCPTAEARQQRLNMFSDSGTPAGWHYTSRAATATALQEYPGDAGWGPLRWLSEQGTGSGWRSDYRHLRMPHGILALLCGAWPLASLAMTGRRTLRRRRRARAGRCLGCGYDLRGSRERCPECGRDIPAPAGRAVPAPPGPGDSSARPGE